MNPCRHAWRRFNLLTFGVIPALAAAMRHGFERSRRLILPDQFDHVFTHGRGVRTRPGPCANLAAKFILQPEHTSARLGIVVGKRNEKKAIRRNTIKRVIREQFRLSAALSPLDLVVRVTQRFTANSAAELKRQVAQQMRVILAALPLQSSVKHPTGVHIAQAQILASTQPQTP